MSCTLKLRPKMEKGYLENVGYMDLPGVFPFTLGVYSNYRLNYTNSTIKGIGQLKHF